MLSNSNPPEFKVVLLNPELPPKEPSGFSCRILAAILRPLGGTSPGTLRDWYHSSLLRLALRESRSAYYRISSSRYRRTVLNYAEVRRSLPQVSCSDSRNEMQFCSASIRRLSEDRPYLTLADMRLVVEGFFLAAKWYAHLGTLCHSEQQDSSLHTPDAQQIYTASSSSAIDQT